MTDADRIALQELATALESIAVSPAYSHGLKEKARHKAYKIREELDSSK